MGVGNSVNTPFEEIPLFPYKEIRPGKSWQEIIWPSSNGFSPGEISEVTLRGELLQAAKQINLQRPLSQQI